MVLALRTDILEECATVNRPNGIQTAECTLAKPVLCEERGKIMWTDTVVFQICFDWQVKRKSSFCDQWSLK